MPNNNTVITKVPSGSHNGGSHHNSGGNNNGKALVDKSALELMQGTREQLTAAYQAAIRQQPHSEAGSAILSTFMQYIAENSIGPSINQYSPDQMAAYAAAKLAQVRSGLLPEDYPVIGRDEGRGGMMHEDLRGHEVDSSGGEEDDFSENEEPESLKAE